MTSGKLLLVTYSLAERCPVTDSLVGAGYTVDHCSHHQLPDSRLTADVIVMLAQNQMDEASGTVRALRSFASAPIIVIGSDTGRDSIVQCLRAGADDFMHAPVYGPELVERIRLRTSPRHAPGLQVDARSFRALYNGTDLRLPPKEFDLLCELVAHAGIVLTKQYLLNRIWHMPSDIETKTVEVHVQKLRAKLSKVGIAGRLVTVPKRGYM